MRVPTFTFKNKQTGDEVTINQSDYLNDRYQYITNLGSLNNWERIGETSGDEGGYEASKVGSDLAVMIKNKRKIDNKGKKVKFS